MSCKKSCKIPKGINQGQDNTMATSNGTKGKTTAKHYIDK